MLWVHRDKVPWKENDVYFESNELQWRNFCEEDYYGKSLCQKCKDTLLFYEKKTSMVDINQQDILIKILNRLDELEISVKELKKELNAMR